MEKESGASELHIFRKPQVISKDREAYSCYLDDLIFLLESLWCRFGRCVLCVHRFELGLGFFLGLATFSWR
jgi:hypothetical protein